MLESSEVSALEIHKITGFSFSPAVFIKDLTVSRKDVISQESDKSGSAKF